MKTGIKKNSIPVNPKVPVLKTILVSSTEKPKTEEILPIVTSYNDLVNYIESIWLVSIPKSSSVTNHAKNFINGLIVSTSCLTNLEDYMNVYHLSNNQSWLHQNKMTTKKMNNLSDGFILFLHEKDLCKVSEKFYVTNVYGKKINKENGKHSITGIMPPPLILDSAVFIFLKNHIPQWYQQYKVDSPKSSKVVFFHKEKISQESDNIDDLMPFLLDMNVTDLSAERKRIYSRIYEIILKMLYNNIEVSVMAEDDVKQEIVDYLLPTLAFSSYAPVALDQELDEDFDYDDESSITKFAKVDVSTYRNGCLLYAINHLVAKFSGKPENIYSQMKDYLMSGVDGMDHDVYEGDDIIDVKSHLCRIFDNHEMFDDICIMAIAIIMNVSIRVFTRDLVTQFNDSDTILHLYHSDGHFEPLVESKDGDFYLSVTDILDSKDVCAISKRQKVCRKYNEIDSSINDEIDHTQLDKEVNDNDPECVNMNINSTITIKVDKEFPSGKDNKSVEVGCIAEFPCLSCAEQVAVNNNDMVNKNEFELIVNKVEQLTNQVQELTTKLSTVEIENTKLRSEVDTLHNKSIELENINLQLAKEISEQKEENARLRSENKKLVIALSDEKQLNVNLKKENEELKKINYELESKIEKAKNDLSIIKIELESVKQRNSYLLKENEDLKSQLSSRPLVNSVNVETQTITSESFEVNLLSNNTCETIIEDVPNVQILDHEVVTDDETVPIHNISDNNISDVQNEVSSSSTIPISSNARRVINNSFAVEIAKYVGTVYNSVYKNNYSESKIILENAIDEVIGLIQGNIHYILHRNVMENLVPNLDTHIIIGHPT